ncbi:MAG: hypothetical protein HZB53_22595 [Chloroflexi bacterium]|nr:hypothetical protein [Chloroflexota bacterium]
MQHEIAGNKLLEDIAAQLRHFSQEELIALLRDFLADLDEKQQARFRLLLSQGPRPLVAEAQGLADANELMDAIQTLHDDIANDVYVEYGAGYDSEIGEYRGFGDDSWIDKMEGDQLNDLSDELGELSTALGCIGAERAAGHESLL